MALGFLYLVAIIDWASRAVLAWRVARSGFADKDQKPKTGRVALSRVEAGSAPLLDSHSQASIHAVLGRIDSA
jgi:hypothetical protein